MALIRSLGLAAWLTVVPGCGRGTPAPEGRPARAGESASSSGPLELPGKTQPAFGRVGKIAPVVLHPVVEVLVAPGARVKKDQPLVRIDDDEPKADVRNKEAVVKELQTSLERLKAEPRQAEQDEARASLEAARVHTQEAKRHLARITPLWGEGAIAEHRHHEAQAELARAEAEERAASARLQRLLKRPFALEIAELEARIAAAVAAVDAARAELEHYTVVAPLDGIVTILDVSPGTVSRPGTTVWGEVLDLREIDVRCDLTVPQAEGLSTGQGAEVLEEARPQKVWPGRIVYLGRAADPVSGRVPVLVRVENPHERLRCYVNVRVRFGGASPGPGR